MKRDQRNVRENPKGNKEIQESREMSEVASNKLSREYVQGFQTRHKQNSLILAQPNFIRVLIINRNVSFKRKEIVDKLFDDRFLI